MVVGVVNMVRIYMISAAVSAGVGGAAGGWWAAGC